MAVRYLSQKWLDEARRVLGSATRVPGVSASVQSVATGGPEGDVACSWRIEDGVLVDATLAWTPEPDVTFTVAYADAAAIARGDLDPAVAFMQGRVKASGDMKVTLLLLQASSGPEAVAARDALAASTEL